MGRRDIKDTALVKDKVVLVTGAAGNLGAAVCRSLLADNDVIAAYHNQVPDIPSQLSWPVNTRTDTIGKRAWCVQADLNDSRDVARLVEVSLAKYDRVDVVVNAAADIRYHGRLIDSYYDTERPANQLATNTIAPFALISALFHYCWKDQSDDNFAHNRNVLNISSFSGMYVRESAGQAFYGASKAALNVLTLHLALELAPYSIRVNALSPPRFPETIPTEEVVAAISKISDGTATGEIVELASAHEKNVRKDDQRC
jgi:NAD(P)-dependent dehydrogenase (short-subunit alcohol dehydrogenase family)